ncbi:MAG: hypothetical protein HY762_07640 [Planctomycetes bacterium]|nr:hypothetical protein [Planctomycetota bacterium]
MNYRHIFSILAVSFLLLPLFAETDEKAMRTFALKKRWEIELNYQPPRYFTYVDQLDSRHNYLYFVYTLTNKTTEPIRLAVDIVLKTSTNRYCQDSFYPLVEDEIIAAEEKLTGLPLGVRKDAAKKFKERGKYLNGRELWNRGEIKANEILTALAIFDGVDPSADEIEFFFGGLVDVIKQHHEKGNPKLVQEYECKIYRILYTCAGDEFHRVSQSWEEQLLGRKWITRNYGPIGDKETVSKLVEALSYVGDKDKPEEGLAVRLAGWWLLKRLVNVNANYDPTLPVEENKESILLVREWWYCNKEKLTYNWTLNRFEIKQ